MSDSDEVESEPEFLEGYKSLDDFTKETTKIIAEATRAFHGLPDPGSEWSLQKTYPEFNRAMKKGRSKILPIMASLLCHGRINTDNLRGRDTDEKFDFLVEANDDILERIATALDEADGFKRDSEALIVNPSGVAPIIAQKPRRPFVKNQLASSSVASFSNKVDKQAENRKILLATKRFRVVEKPQLKFAETIDNSTAAFVPKLTDKPNSLKPLSILPEFDEHNTEFYGHPYQLELVRWHPLNSMLSKVKPKVPKAVEDTVIVYVDTVDGLNDLLADLQNPNIKEFAVDLEHHSLRTYLGLTCLIQISTRDKDYVIDALAVRNDLHCLNHVFTKPNVIKVFHGASSDIEWLQRDFGVYVVGMFDTQVAARVMNLAELSLKALLGRYCKMNVDKSFQLADWRFRPLPEAWIEYARQDTHFLLYIYDLMRNELIDGGNEHNNLLTSAFDQSRFVCLKRYEKPGSNPLVALRRARRNFNNRQVFAFSEIYNWRDTIAREKDESLGYVLSTHMLLNIAEVLPKEVSGILACCDPVPALLQSNLQVVHRIITKARNLPLHEETVKHNHIPKKTKLKGWEQWNSVHDVVTIDVPNSVPDSEIEAMLPSSLKAIEDIDSSKVTGWPLPAKTNSISSDSIVVRSKPVAPFFYGLSGIIPAQASKAVKPKLKHVPHIIPDKVKAFQRYVVSNVILDMLKDTTKTKQLLNDPVIKIVHDTILHDPSDQEEDRSREILEGLMAKVPIENVQVRPEFIPFNPMAKLRDRKKKKNKEPKHATWDDSVPKKEPVQDIILNSDPEENGEISNNEDDRVPNDVEFIVDTQSTKERKNKKKGKSKNLFHRLQAVGKKATKYMKSPLKNVHQEPEPQQSLSGIKRKSDTPHEKHWNNKRSRGGGGNRNVSSVKGQGSSHHDAEEPVAQQRRGKGFFRGGRGGGRGRGRRDVSGRSMTFRV